MKTHALWEPGALIAIKMARLTTHENPIIREYLNRGFGTMTKNDFEVMVLHELLKTNLRGKSNYEISKTLCIPESKVKRLIYEVNLRYQTNEIVYLENFIDSLLGCKKIGDGGKIKFIIEDVATRRYLDNELKKKHLFSDTSWNTEIVVMTPQSLATILEALLTSQHADMVQEKVEKVKQELAKEEFLVIIKDLLCGITQGIASSAISKFFNFFQQKTNKNS